MIKQNLGIHQIAIQVYPKEIRSMSAEPNKRVFLSENIAQKFEIIKRQFHPA